MGRIKGQPLTPAKSDAISGWELWNATCATVVAHTLFRARGWLDAGLGLLTRPPLSLGEAVWLVPAGSVHTCGLRYVIDVVFLDRSGIVLSIARRVTPWRVVWAPRGTWSVVELPAGGAAHIRERDRLEVREITSKTE